jgi:hypothetical protein
VTVSRFLMANVPLFFLYAEEISGGAAFTHPCGVIWCESVGGWIGKCPGWFDPWTPRCLAAWALAIIEKTVWRRFLDLNQCDVLRPLGYEFVPAMAGKMSHERL